jgi:polar amino acid transport system substrate-binding protein
MQSERNVLALRRAVSMLLALSGLCLILPASAATLDRIKETGHIKLGYLVDARPFTFRTPSGQPGGYSVTLCEQVAERVKSQLALDTLTVDWVPVTAESRFEEVQQGNVDLLCTPASDNLTNRQEVAFSLPIFPGGVRAVLRSDAPTTLRDALSGSPNTRPVWRGSPAAKVLEQQRFAVVAGTAAERLFKERLATFQIKAQTVSVPDYRTGLQQLQDGKVDVFFGDRAVVLGQLEGAAWEKVVILDRLLTNEPYALALARNDDDFRLVVDSSLSHLYATPTFSKTYSQWLGDLDDRTRAFFAWQARRE